MDLSASKRENGLLSLNFNQDYSCIALGSDAGFYVMNADPLKERFRRRFGGSATGGADEPAGGAAAAAAATTTTTTTTTATGAGAGAGAGGGIRIVEMLFKCNILALVGGGERPKYPPNKVMIWDDYQGKCIAELEFRAPVRNVKLRRDRVVVALDRKVYVYNFADLQLLAQLETHANPRGLVALAPSPEHMVLAVPGVQPGSVKCECYTTSTSQTIAAHHAPLACLALTYDGRLLATASDKGTLVRIFDTESGEMLKELRRGADRATVHSLAFNASATALVVASDKCTAHVFTLPPRATAAKSSAAATAGGASASRQNKTSSLSFLKDMLPSYFSSEWSMASFPIPARAIAAFGPVPDSIIVVAGDGSYEKWVLATNGKGAYERIISDSVLPRQIE